MLINHPWPGGKINHPRFTAIFRTPVDETHTLLFHVTFTPYVDGKLPELPNISKLSMSEIVRKQRDIGLGILGPYGTLHAYKAEDQGPLAEATGNPFAAMVTGMALFAQGPPIYGGTDQIQKNIIGERVLGLPKEAYNDKTAAFKDLPKNA